MHFDDVWVGNKWVFLIKLDKWAARRDNLLAIRKHHLSVLDETLEYCHHLNWRFISLVDDKHITVPHCPY